MGRYEGHEDEETEKMLSTIGKEGKESERGKERE